MKALLFRASDFNRGIERVTGVELNTIGALRSLMMQVEYPILIGPAAESDAPAEVTIMIYDDEIF
jgi:hypothetical protein